MNILLIEPHGDDSLCSASSVLRSTKFNVDVLTLSGRPSHGLKDLYPSVNSTVFLDLPDLDYYRRPKVNTHEIHKMFIEGINVYTYYLDLIYDTLYNDCQATEDSISEFVYSYITDYYDVILLPVGLCHPYHIITGKSIRKLGNLNFILYQDKPYYQYRYVKEMYESFKKFSNYKVEFKSPTVDKEDSVIDTFRRVYPTEISMLRFSRDILTKSEDTYISLPFEVNVINAFKEGLM